MSPRFKELMSKAVGIDISDYDGSIINIYNQDSFIGNHPDIDESVTASKYPVVVVNLGGPGNIILGQDKDSVKVNFKSGSAYLFGFNGVNRTIPHSTYASTIKGNLPALTTKIDNETYPAGSYRVTITMRRVMPLTPGIPNTPKLLSVTPTATTEIKGELFDPSLPKVNIYAGTGENAELSNFANRPVKLGNETFRTPEGAYQAMKIWFTNAVLLGTPASKENIEIVEKLKTASGAEAKSLGRKIKDLSNATWDRDSSGVMRNILKLSFEQNPDALAKLLATGNAELTHTQDKGKWGKEFPKLLMEVRQELTQPTTEEIILRDGKSYNKQEINSKMLEKMGYTPMEIGKLLKEICG